MKKILLGLCLFVSAKSAFSQDYLTGKLTDDKKAVSTIYYDRTQLLVNNKVHQTLYKVLDEHKKSLYTISVTNDEKKSTVLISVIVEDSATMNRTVGYNRQKCGLIFSDGGDLDTVFPATKQYSYLFSFADTLRDYPVLHKINTLDQKVIDLDPLSKLRVKKHNELVRKFYPTPASNLSADERSKENSLFYNLLNDTFNNQLFALRDSLYMYNSGYIDVITKMKAEVEYDYSVYMKVARAYNDDDKYDGDEKNEQPHGKGLLVSNGNVYDGTFATGLFITGKAIIKTKAYTYYGESYKDSMSGQGWLKYTNGSFLLGTFRNGHFCDGISLVKDADEVFFGSMKNNQRTGYGELRNNRGDIYYGEFLHGRFIKGYAKEVDQFGYSTYSRIQNGVKATVPAQLAEIFFDKVHVMKEKAEVQPQ